MKKILVVIMTMLFCFMPFAGCANNNTDKGKQYWIRNISFSPDGKKLIFDGNKSYQPCMIHTYNLETGELIAYKSPIGEKWHYPQYSFDGEYIVFVTVPLLVPKISIFHSERTIYEDFPINSQIAIMDNDGKNLRKITNTTGIKTDPSFSHSGRKIIFARADEKEGKPRRGWNWSANDVDLKTGQETCLTQFKFINKFRPYYFPDDKTFIFYGEYLTRIPGISDDDKSTENFRKVERIRNELKSKYQDNSIYIMQGNEKEIKPYIVMPDYQKKFKGYYGYEYSRDPSLSADGSVLIFRAQGYKPDGSADGDHLYQYSADGDHRSITRVPPMLTGETVSPDGELVSVIANEHNIIIYQVKDGKSRKITLPDKPSRIVNSQ